MKKFLALGAFGLLLVLAIFGTTLAISDAKFSVDNVFKINSDGSGTVSNVFNATNSTDAKSPEKIIIPIAGNEPSSITAKVNDKATAASISQDGSAIEVKLPNLTGKGKKWKLALSYKSKMLQTLGSTETVQIPTFNEIGLDITSEKTVVKVDLGAGLASALPTPDKTDIATGEQIFTYENKSGAVSDTVTLLFDDRATTILDVSTELKNNGWWWKNVEITLPPDTNQQQVIVQSIEPRPSNVRLDQDGNILAQYRLGPKKSINITAKVAVNISSLSYSLDGEKQLSDISQSLKDLYTAQTDKWYPGRVEVTVNPVAPVSEIVDKVYSAVVDLASEETAFQDNTEYSGSQIDNSSNYSDILIGELRAQGVPAREVLGKLVTNGQTILPSSSSHYWAEAYVPDAGWVTLDPSLAAYADYYGKTDILHTGLALWGVSDHLPPIDLDSMTVSYAEEEATVPEDTPQVSATKTVIFPGVSIMNVDVAMPAGVINDGNALQFSNQLYLLGSLAPYQTSQTKVFKFGAAAFNNEPVEYGYTDGQVLTTSVVTVQSTTSYVVMIVAAVLLLLTIIFIFIIRRRRKAAKYKPSKDSLIMHDEDDGGEVESVDLVGDKPIDQPMPETSQHQTPPTPPNPDSKPPITRDTINSSQKSNGFQQPNPENPRRHIIQ